MGAAGRNVGADVEFHHRRRVPNMQTGHVGEFRHLFHFRVIDPVDRVLRCMIIRCRPAEDPDAGNAALDMRILVAPEKDMVGVAALQTNITERFGRSIIWLISKSSPPSARYLSRSAGEFRGSKKVQVDFHVRSPDGFKAPGIGRERSRREKTQRKKNDHCNRSVVLMAHLKKRNFLSFSDRIAREG